MLVNLPFETMGGSASFFKRILIRLHFLCFSLRFPSPTSLVNAFSLPVLVNHYLCFSELNSTPPQQKNLRTDTKTRRGEGKEGTSIPRAKPSLSCPLHLPLPLPSHCVLASSFPCALPFHPHTPQHRAKQMKRSPPTSSSCSSSSSSSCAVAGPCDPNHHQQDKKPRSKRSRKSQINNANSPNSATCSRRSSIYRGVTR